MKVSVDRDECISCSVCWSECPELFAEDPGDGKCRIVAGYAAPGDGSSGEAPEELRAAAQKAEGACPVGIIHVD